MKQLYKDSLTKVKDLYVGCDDAIHDLRHSERTSENARLIASEVGYEDPDFLEVCAYWHDAARTKGISEGHEEAGAIMARDDLLQRGASQEEAERIYEAIRFHKSTDSPTTIEGKIIRDADKLDIYAVERWKKCAEEGWRKDYTDDLGRTIRNMDRYPDVFTYDFTKKVYQKRVAEFLAYYESIKHQLPNH